MSEKSELDSVGRPETAADATVVFAASTLHSLGLMVCSALL